LILFTGIEERVGIFDSGIFRIRWFLGEFHTGRTDGVNDRISYGSLSPNKTSGEGYSGTIGGSWVVSGFYIGDIKSFFYIGEIGYTGAITGRERISSETDECYGTEDDKDGDDHYEFDESESEEILLGMFWVGVVRFVSMR
jgi:hypothetical protein